MKGILSREHAEKPDLIIRKIAACDAALAR